MKCVGYVNCDHRALKTASPPVKYASSGVLLFADDWDEKTQWAFSSKGHMISFQAGGRCFESTEMWQILFCFMNEDG